MAALSLSSCEGQFRSLVLSLQGAHNVKAADSNGFSDPYAIIWHVRNVTSGGGGLASSSSDPSVAGALSSSSGAAARAIGSAAAPIPSKFDSLRKKIVGRTHICYATLNPVWEYQTFLPSVSLQNDGLYIEVWDYDEKSADDFLGACFVYLSNGLLRTGKEVPLMLSPRPKKKDTRITGYIDVRFDFEEPVESSLLVRKRLKASTRLRESMGRAAPTSFTAYQRPDDGEKSPRGRTTPPLSPGPGPTLRNKSRSPGRLSLTSSSTTQTAIFDEDDDDDDDTNTDASQSSQPAQLAGNPFALELVVHSAAELRRPGSDTAQYDPFVVVSLSSPEATRCRTLARSHIQQRTSHASWELRCLVPSMYRNERLHIDVRDWNKSKGDVFMGRTSVEFGRDPKIGTSVENYPFPLHRRSDADKPISDKAAVRLSYHVRAAHGELSSCPFAHDLIDWSAVPDLAVHSKNYGVSLPNFRDIGGWPIRFRDRKTGITVTGRMRERVVFRTSAIHRATENDANIIKNELNIRNFCDLRTPDYAGNRGPFCSALLTVLEPNADGTWSTSSQKIIVNEHEHSKIVERSAEQQSYAAAAGKLLAHRDADPADIPDLDGPKYDWSAEDAASPLGSQNWGHLYLVNLVGPKFRTKMITLSKKTALVQAGFASTPQQQRRLICGPIFDPRTFFYSFHSFISHSFFFSFFILFYFSFFFHFDFDFLADGITRLYFLLVECCKREFCLLFKLLLVLTEQGPVGYFCNHGKDRTGLTTAFLQLICGVNRETVIDCYQLSDMFLQPIAQEVDDEMADGGLTPAVMSRTPGRALRSTLLYLDHKYGGPLEYLEHIGFGYEEQDVLRSRLVSIDPRYSPANLKKMSFQMLRTFSHATITIHSARNLLPSDSSGSSDPFVKVTSLSTLVSEVRLNTPKLLGQTDVQRDSLDPQWNYTFETPYAINPGTKILFEVRDADENCEDDYIGTAEYSLDPPEPFADVHQLELLLKPSNSTLVVSIVFHAAAKAQLSAAVDSSGSDNDDDDE